MGYGQDRPYTAGVFQMSLDGERTTAYLKSIQGGLQWLEYVQDRFGEANKRVTHHTVADIDEVSFEFGMSGAQPVLKWIKDSWDKHYSFRSGQIDHADFNTDIQLTQEFSDALITETTFPTLDGA